MKCFCPVNGLYCKNPEYARLLPPREKKSSLTREKLRPRLDFAILQVRSMGETPPPLRILAESQYGRKYLPRKFAILQAHSITSGVLTQKPAC